MKIPINKIKLHFMPRCDCGVPATVTPADLEEIGIFFCAECDREYELASHGEVSTASRRIVIYSITAYTSKGAIVLKVAIETEADMTKVNAIIEDKARTAVLTQHPGCHIHHFSLPTYVTYASF